VLTWGERFLFEAGETRSELVDSAKGRPVGILQVRAEDGRLLTAQDCLRKVVRHT